jgi:hypothetical protein
MDDDTFLVNPASDALFQLNGTATAIWRLLAEPMEIEDVVSGLAEAFPDVAAGTIRADARAVIAQLAGRGLVVRCEDTPSDPT